MKVLRFVDGSASPLKREEELLSRLLAAGVCGPERLRLTIAGRRLFLDGFVHSVDQKFRVERACCRLALGRTVVNRLRVAAIEGRQVS